MTPISAILEEIADWDPALRACIRRFPRALNWTILEDGVEPRWVSNGGKVSVRCVLAPLACVLTLLDDQIAFAGDSVHPLSVRMSVTGLVVSSAARKLSRWCSSRGGRRDRRALSRARGRNP